jgi:DNA-3-methyladenine glycosylase II
MDEQIVKYFLDVDPLMGTLATSAQDIRTPQKRPNLMLDLMSSIASQQLSVKAAATIWGRALKLFDSAQPETILLVSEDELRSAGLSYQKARYLHNIARSETEGLVNFAQLDQLSDDEIVSELTQIKGVGQWTAEMFLIFALARPDVFSAGDLGLINAIKKLYNLPNLTKPEAVEMSKKWSPHRSTACLLLWHSLDNKPK